MTGLAGPRHSALPAAEPASTHGCGLESSHAASRRKPSRSRPPAGCQSVSSAVSPFVREHSIVAWRSSRAASRCRRRHDPGKPQYTGTCCRHPACLAERRRFARSACLWCTATCLPASIRRAPYLLNTRDLPAELLGPPTPPRDARHPKQRGPALRTVISVHACLAQPHRSPLLSFASSQTCARWRQALPLRQGEWIAHPGSGINAFPCTPALAAGIC